MAVSLLLRGRTMRKPGDQALASGGRTESCADHSSTMRKEPKFSTWALAMPSTRAVRLGRARRAPVAIMYDASPTISPSVPSSVRLVGLR